VINLAKIDVNLLYLFKLLYEHRNIKKVSEILDVSQSAISHSMKRLKLCLGDQLFYRASSGLAPTPYAEEISKTIISCFDSIEQSINSNLNFEPLKSKRVFNVSMSDVGEVLFLPKLISHLATVAPDAAIEIVRCSSQNIQKEMELGNIDIAIGLLPELTTGFHQRRLFTQKYKLMLRKDHPLLCEKVTRDSILKYKHISISSKDTGHSIIEKYLQTNHIDRVVASRLTHFIAVPYVLGASDLIATVPEKLDDMTGAHFDVITIDHPLKLPEIQINIFWHARLHEDSANTWLRRLIFDLFSE
jgi:DNA-binding transcriptional LysR family regulator